MNNITARLTWQNPESLEIEPWVADGLDGQRGCHGVHVRPPRRRDLLRRHPVDAAAVAKNFDTYGLGNEELGLTISEAINNYASSEVVDADTVTFRFSAPAPGFLQATSTINSGLLSPDDARPEARGLRRGQRDRDRRLGPVRHHRARRSAPTLTLEAREDYDWAPPRSSTRAARTSTRSTWS